jgi:uncharacterized C2H2 Zn-finger protein
MSSDNTSNSDSDNNPYSIRSRTQYFESLTNQNNLYVPSNIDINIEIETPSIASHRPRRPQSLLSTRLSLPPPPPPLLPPPLTPEQVVKRFSRSSMLRFYTCNVCGLSFNSSITYIEHIQQNYCAEYNLPDDMDDQKCPSCDLVFKNSYLLGEHFMTNHEDYTTFSSLDVSNHDGFPEESAIQMIKYVIYVDAIIHMI